MAIFGSNNVFLSSYVLGSINGFVAGPRFPVQKELVLRDLQKRCKKKKVYGFRFSLNWCSGICKQIAKDKKKMPEVRRPPKNVRQLLAAQHSRYQAQSAGLLMSTAHVMAHAARALRPLDEDGLAELMDASASDSLGPRQPPALEDIVGNITSGKSVRSVYKSAANALELGEKGKRRDKRRQEENDDAADAQSVNSSEKPRPWDEERARRRARNEEISKEKAIDKKNDDRPRRDEDDRRRRDEGDRRCRSEDDRRRQDDRRRDRSRATSRDDDRGRSHKRATGSQRAAATTDSPGDRWSMASERQTSAWLEQRAAEQQRQIHRETAVSPAPAGKVVLKDNVEVEENKFESTKAKILQSNAKILQTKANVDKQKRKRW